MPNVLIFQNEFQRRGLGRYGASEPVQSIQENGSDSDADDEDVGKNKRTLKKDERCSARLGKCWDVHEGRGKLRNHVITAVAPSFGFRMDQAISTSAELMCICGSMARAGILAEIPLTPRFISAHSGQNSIIHVSSR